MSYIFLGIAILSEVTATSTLKATEEFTKLFPSLIVVAGYLSSLYFMTLSLRTIPVGIVYATWSGIGMVLITSAGYFFYSQRLDFPAMLGIALIIAGVATIHLFSKNAGI
jgi:small multidrug resistance pump